MTLASAARGARPKRKLTAVARESWTIESSSSRRQQPNSERRTRSSTHTVNLPLLPAETANGAYGPQNLEDRTSLGMNLRSHSISTFNRYDRRMAARLRLLIL